ncbi:hypothetical protein CHUAL_002273 [Chamberlinius hualienensis]
MRSTRSDRSSTYTLVPQSVSDEDEGVFEESPESSQQQTELLSTESGEFVHPSCTSPDRIELKSYSPTERIVPSPTFQPTVTTPHFKTMSPARKCCFVTGLFACVAHVMALIWLVPCNWLPCTEFRPNDKMPMIIKEWNTTLSLIGSISEPRPVVISSSGETVLVFAFQLMERNASASESAKNVEPASGVMAISGTSGEKIWKQMFYTRVEDVVCNITDVNLDNIPDCAIVGSMGLLAAINASNGHTFWYLHNHDEQPLLSDRVSSPRPLPTIDINKDGVKDFMLLGTLTGDYNKLHYSNVVQLLLVSGSTGEIIGQPVSCPYNYLNEDAMQLPTPIVIKLPNSTYFIIYAAQGCSKNSTEYSGTVVVVGLTSFIKRALEQHFSQLFNLPNTKINYTVYEEFCIIGRIKRIIVDDNDQSQGLILAVNDEHSILYGYDFSNSFQLKWKYRKENYTIKEASIGKFKNKSVALVALKKEDNCTSTYCQHYYMLLDLTNGELIQAFEINCSLSNIVHFTQNYKTFPSDVFIIQTANASNTSLNSNVAFIMSSKKLLTYNIDDGVKNTCKGMKTSTFAFFKSLKQFQF